MLGGPQRPGAAGGRNPAPRLAGKTPGPDRLPRWCLALEKSAVPPSDGRNARYLGNAVEPVVLAEGEQPLGLGGEHADGRLRLGLAVEDPVLVAARADLGTLRGIGGPHRGG